MKFRRKRFVFMCIERRRPVKRRNDLMKRRYKAVICESVKQEYRGKGKGKLKGTDDIGNVEIIL